MDFTATMYRTLCEALVRLEYNSTPFGEYKLDPSGGQPRVFLRHDVDRAPSTAITLAEIEKRLGLKATYFFRCVKSAFVPDVIKKVRDLGMEIGYHYECLDRADGDFPRAFEIARADLEMLRQLAPVKSMAMHGNPLTPYDNRDMWKKYDFADLDIEVAAYFSIDYSKLEYFTDTGRNWDENRGNLYDTVTGAARPSLGDTASLIEYLASRRPDCCISTHPHRWTNNPVSWLYNALYDNAGNLIKSVIKRRRRDR